MIFRYFLRTKTWYLQPATTLSLSLSVFFLLFWPCKNTLSLNGLDQCVESPLDQGVASSSVCVVVCASFCRVTQCYVILQQ